MNTVISKDSRIEQILDYIYQIAAGNVEAECLPSDRGDELDAIIVGLNMLSEELSATALERDQAEKLLVQSHNELEIKVRERTVDYRAAMERAKESDRLKSEFVANISHELRTPMHAILNYSKYGTVKSNTLSREKSLHYFKNIRKAGERLMRLLNDLLDLSKMEAGKETYQMEIINIWKIVQDAVLELKPFSDKKGITLNIPNPEAHVTVRCDGYKIGQVIRNLVSNAIQYSPEKGIIQIVFKEDKIQIEDKFHPALRMLCIDQGVGIPKNELVSVFDKFNQSSKTYTGAGGTGLGLSISQGIIRAHNGRIWAENNPGGGVTMIFVLPYELRGHLT